MGGGKGMKHQNALSLMPVSAYNADKRIESLQLQFKIDITSMTLQMRYYIDFISIQHASD